MSASRSVRHALCRYSDARTNHRVAHRAGVTYATTTFLHSHVFSRSVFVGGLSATFRTGASNGMQRAAVIKSVTALHISIGRTAPVSPSYPGVSVSTEIAVLRRLLMGGEDEHTETGKWFKKAASVSDRQREGITETLSSKWDL